MNKLLKHLLLVPLVVVPVITFAAEHSNHDRGGDRHDQGRHDNRHDNNHDNRGNDRGRDHSRNDDRRDHSNVRVSIGVGGGVRYGSNSLFDNWSYGVGYNSYGGQYYSNRSYPYYSDWGYSSRPVVIERNTYIEQPATRVYTNRTNETSLLRAVNGRCYERSYDRYGNESRVELDADECDF